MDDPLLCSGVTGDVVPLDAVLVAVVEHGQAGLVMPLLQKKSQNSFKSSFLSRDIDMETLEVF